MKHRIGVVAVVAGLGFVGACNDTSGTRGAPKQADTSGGGGAPVRDDTSGAGGVPAQADLTGTGGVPGTESAMVDERRYVLDVNANMIDGTPKHLRDYEGDVVLIVNVASRCGLTPQYEGLEKLYEDHKEDGLVVLGFPANDFKGQEPGTNGEIAEFCRSEYGVTFPMFEKVAVIGDQSHPLYRKLSALSAEPDWNFTKYLIDREGNLVERFGPEVKPDDPTLVGKIEEELGKG